MLLIIAMCYNSLIMRRRTGFEFHLLFSGSSFQFKNAIITIIRYYYYCCSLWCDRWWWSVDSCVCVPYTLFHIDYYSFRFITLVDNFLYCFVRLWSADSHRKLKQKSQQSHPNRVIVLVCRVCIVHHPLTHTHTLLQQRQTNSLILFSQFSLFVHIAPLPLLPTLSSVHFSVSIEASEWETDDDLSPPLYVRTGRQSLLYCANR